jgi:hypothetical protein
MSFFCGKGSPSSIRTERQTLSTTEHADVTASSGSFSALASAIMSIFPLGYSCQPRNLRSRSQLNWWELSYVPPGGSCAAG